MQPFRNTFSEQSGTYAKARPRYPLALYEWVAQQCLRRDQAWDCATGSGQAAVGLSPHFRKIQATDISEEQISHALPGENIVYSVRSAEASDFPPESFDLIAVAQALHWFDYAQFWQEVSRVAKRNALFCAWGYDWLSSTTEVDEVLIRPFRSILQPFWAPNNQLLWNGYRDKDIAFPYERLETPSFAIETWWTLEQLLDYMMTWSAFKHSRADADAVASMDGLIARARNQVTPDEKLPIRMPLKMVAGRVCPKPI